MFFFRLKIVLSIIVFDPIFKSDFGFFVKFFILEPVPAHNTTAANFLEIGTSSNAVGMGEAYVSLADDAISAYWNPAGLASVKGFEFGLSSQEWVVGIDHANFAAAVNMGRFGTISAWFTDFDYGSIEVWHTNKQTFKTNKSNENNQKINFIFYLNVNKVETMKRIEKRKILEKRLDDNFNTILKRYDTYMETTRPVLDFYSKNTNFYEIDGTLEIDEISAKIDVFLNF